MKKLIILFLLLFLTGCYNYKELNKIAITSAMGIDKTSDGYKVVVQVINTQKEETSKDSNSPQFTLYQSTGKTIDEALSNMILESPRDIYLNHMSLLIISENIAKEGLNKIIDVFARNTNFRKQFLVVLSKDNTPEEILSILTNLESLNAKNIKDSIVTDNELLGSSNYLTFEDLLTNLLNDKEELTIPSVTIIGNKNKGNSNTNTEKTIPDAHLVLSELAIFKNDKLIGFLNKNDSINLSFIKDKIKESTYTFTCNQNNYGTIKITNSKTNTKINKNNLDINIDIEGYISEIDCNIDLNNYKEIEKLENRIEKEFSSSILNTINNNIQKYNSDIFGFKDLIYKQNPNNYKINHNLKDLNFKINTNLKLITKGNILKEI